MIHKRATKRNYF